MFVLLLVVLAAAAPFLYALYYLCKGSLWYAKNYERIYCNVKNPSDHLLTPPAIPQLWLGALTCPLRCRPDVYVIGAHKAASSSLHFYLTQHPRITGGPVKESQYFMGRSPFHNYFDRLDWLVYRAFFPTYFYVWWRRLRVGGRTMVVDSTPILRAPWLARRMKAAAPNAKVVCVLREPVSRAISHYYMMKDGRPVQEHLSFEQVVREQQTRTRYREWAPRLFREQSNASLWAAGVDVGYKLIEESYVDAGIYYPKLQEFIRHFGRDKVLLLTFEELTRDPQTATNKVFAFLGLEPIHIDSEPKNTGVNKEHVHISPELNRFLESEFSPSNRAMYEEYGLEECKTWNQRYTA